MTLWVVAVSQKEADTLAATHGWDSKAEAMEHLEKVKAPPTDPYYASQYKVYRVSLVAQSREALSRERNGG